MAKWTVTEYSALLFDGNGYALPAYPAPKVTTKYTAAGDIAISAGTRFFRICGDTAAHVKVGATGATDSDPYIPAGGEFTGAIAGPATCSFIVG